MRMFTGDLKPDLIITLSDPDQAVSTATATNIRIIGRREGTIVFDRAPDDTDIVDPVTVLTMLWQAGDTDEIGRIQVEVEVTWPGNKPQTFRADSGVDVAADFDLVP